MPNLRNVSNHVAALLASFAALVGFAIPAVPAAAATRQTADQPDDQPGYAQVHALYVLPSDGVDSHLDENGDIANSVNSWETWLLGQPGGAGLNLDTAGGQLDVTFVRLAQDDATLAAFGTHLRDELERQLKALGFSKPSTVYAVYYDGTAQASACGGGAWPPDLPGTVAALYLHGQLDPAFPQCDTSTFAGPG